MSISKKNLIIFAISLSSNYQLSAAYLPTLENQMPRTLPAEAITGKQKNNYQNHPTPVRRTLFDNNYMDERNTRFLRGVYTQDEFTVKDRMCQITLDYLLSNFVEKDRNHTQELVEWAHEIECPDLADTIVKAASLQQDKTNRQFLNAVYARNENNVKDLISKTALNYLLCNFSEKSKEFTQELLAWADEIECPCLVDTITQAVERSREIRIAEKTKNKLNDFSIDWNNPFDPTESYAFISEIKDTNNDIHSDPVQPVKKKKNRAQKGALPTRRSERKKNLPDRFIPGK